MSLADRAEIARSHADEAQIRANEEERRRHLAKVDGIIDRAKDDARVLAEGGFYQEEPDVRWVWERPPPQVTHEGWFQPSRYGFAMLVDGDLHVKVTADGYGGCHFVVVDCCPNCGLWIPRGDPERWNKSPHHHWGDPLPKLGAMLHRDRLVHDCEEEE